MAARNSYVCDPALIGASQSTMPGIGSFGGFSIDSNAWTSAWPFKLSDREYSNPYVSSCAVPADSHSLMYGVGGCRVFDVTEEQQVGLSLEHQDGDVQVGAYVSRIGRDDVGLRRLRQVGAVVPSAVDEVPVIDARRERLDGIDVGRQIDGGLRLPDSRAPASAPGR